MYQKLPAFNEILAAADLTSSVEYLRQQAVHRRRYCINRGIDPDVVCRALHDPAVGF